MRAAVVTVILVMCLIGALSVLHDKATNAGLPLVRTAAVAQPEAVPWVLNTRCIITSRNLPQREPEETI